ncbi:hypothetical protein [Cognatiyoonia sp. IB215182]|uniref:hypothetical protein n=1 Tax=Cognatiyoonia sp. IB215182 TaxID=3097353 RepID=UPI002A23B84B|nr:hypothetical protein [Cognatiyoonia sp. IB215182]
MVHIEWPACVWLKTVSIRNKSSLLLTGRFGLSYHRFMLRVGADSSTHRLHHPYGLITVSGLDGLTRAVAVSSLGSDVTPSHFSTIRMDCAETALCRSPTVVHLWLRLKQSLRQTPLLNPHFR